MATITEDYVSFETAKLLKSKKFHIPTRSHYDGRGGFGFFDICEIDWNNYKCFKERRCYSAPTLQMAMKWLRKEHNILLFLLPAQENGKLVYLVEVWTWNEEEGIYESVYAPMPRKEPEQAIKAAIKYCLENLI